MPARSTALTETERAAYLASLAKIIAALERLASNKQ